MKWWWPSKTQGNSPSPLNSTGYGSRISPWTIDDADNCWRRDAQSDRASSTVHSHCSEELASGSHQTTLPPPTAGWQQIGDKRWRGRGAPTKVTHVLESHASSQLRKKKSAPESWYWRWMVKIGGFFSGMQSRAIILPLLPTKVRTPFYPFGAFRGPTLSTINTQFLML
jgi:hypothetical protein